MKRSVNSQTALCFPDERQEYYQHAASVLGYEQFLAGCYEFLKFKSLPKSSKARTTEPVKVAAYDEEEADARDGERLTTEKSVESGPGFESAHLQDVYRELSYISRKLQHENKRLQEWDAELLLREKHLDEAERRLAEYAASLQQAIDAQVSKRCSSLEEEFTRKKTEFEEDVKKTRSAFKIIKAANVSLKKQASESEAKMHAYEEKQKTLKNRVFNLERSCEILKQRNEGVCTEKTRDHTIDNKDKKQKGEGCKGKQVHEVINNESFLEVFGGLLEWAADIHLRPNINHVVSTPSPTDEHDVNVEITNERCLKVMASLPPVLQRLCSLNSTVQLSFLKFVYWTLLHVSMTQKSQKSSCATTCRRIGEQVLGSEIASASKSIGFITSSDQHTRILSCLIVLHTLSPADVMVKVLSSLNLDLRKEMGKELFLYYQGTHILLTLFRSTQSGTVNHTIDLMMLLAADSPHLASFLDCLSNMEWIKTILICMQKNKDNSQVLEKLSLIMQRLSKLRTNKPHFEALQLREVISGLARLCSPDEEFLQLNLRSILFNIDAMKLK